MNSSVIFADTWEFGSSGSGKNPFTPRGYLVDTEKGQHWLRSPFDNSGPVIRYTGGAQNGIDYLDAKKSDGSGYTFYAMTDRNPYPDEGRLGYGKSQMYLFAYKDGVRINNFTDYVRTPATRGDKVDPSGIGTCWVFKIEGFELEPGCQYEFGFLRGMQANNGITLVLNEAGGDKAYGYIQQPKGGSLTSEEQSIYDAQKNREYEFISSWSKASKEEDGRQLYKVNRVPMRFSVQTYADLSQWEKGREKSQTFLDSVTEQDLKKGKYKRENIKQLRLMLEDLDKKAEDEVKLLLQSAADKKIKSMLGDLEAMLEIARSEKPEPADMRALTAKLKEAKELYARASANVGNDKGQYGRIEVETLKEEIEKAEEMDRYTPQNEINNEVEALEEAMIEVKASMVQKEQRIFYDKITGIYVIAPADSLSEDARLFVRRMGKETEEYQSIENHLSEKENEAVFYRIQFYESDRKIQPKEEVEVQMPILEDISQKSSTIYSVGEAGELEEVNSVKANGTQFFETAHLEAFVMAGSMATEEEKAAKREERLKEMMRQKNDEDTDEADEKVNQLEKKKKKKEEYKDPLNKILKRNERTATFSNDVRKETDPQGIIIAAVVLAAAAILLGIRGLYRSRREKESGR